MEKWSWAGFFPKGLNYFSGELRKKHSSKYWRDCPWQLIAKARYINRPYEGDLFFSFSAINQAVIGTPGHEKIGNDLEVSSCEGYGIAREWRVATLPRQRACHASQLVQQFRAKHRISQTPQPPYSPDIGPCGFFPISKDKISLGRKKYFRISRRYSRLRRGSCTPYQKMI